jgi:RimJ/RimL family protein N-acetyltransferase
MVIYTSISVRIPHPRYSQKHNLTRLNQPRFPAEQAGPVIQGMLKSAQPTIDLLQPEEDDEGEFEPLAPDESKSYTFPFNAIRILDNDVIGCISLVPFEHDSRGLTSEQMLDLPRDEQVWLLGYFLDPKYHRQGIMFEALKMVLDVWVKGWMKIGKVVAGVDVENVGSERLLEKLGFKREMVLEIPWPSGGMRKLGHWVLDMTEDRVEGSGVAGSKEIAGLEEEQAGSALQDKVKPSISVKDEEVAQSNASDKEPVAAEEKERPSKKARKSKKEKK